MHRMLRLAWKRIVKKSYAVSGSVRLSSAAYERSDEEQTVHLISNGIDIEKYKAEPGCKTRSIL